MQAAEIIWNEAKEVFISYKAEEKEEAIWVKSVLESNGISCWMAPACIPGGSNYAVEIPRAIRQAKIFVLILSSKAQSSRWVSKEVDLAINEGKIILPFMLENCALRDDFNFYLTNVQRYAAYENKVTAIEKMLKEIKAIVGSSNAELNAEPHIKATVETKEKEIKKEAVKNNVVAAANVEELLLRVKALKAKGATTENAKEICETYERVCEKTRKHSLNKDVFYDYAEFLYYQKDYNRATEIAEELKYYYSNPREKVKEYKKARLYNLLGLLYCETNRYSEAEITYKKAIEIYECLAKQNPEAYEGDLATSYNNIGILHHKTNRQGETEKANKATNTIKNENTAKVDPENKPKRKYDKKSIWSLVLGILAGCTTFPGFAWIPGIVAEILSVLSLDSIKKNNLEGKGLSVAGFILGLVGTVFGGAMMLGWAGVVGGILLSAFPLVFFIKKYKSMKA